MKTPLSCFSDKDMLSFIKALKLINTTLDLNELLANIMKIAKKIMNVEAASILLYDKAENKLFFEVALSSVGQKLKQKVYVDLNEGIAGWCAKNRQPVLANDAKKDKRFKCKFDKDSGFVTKSILSIPLIAKNRLIGVAQVLNKKNNEKFSDFDKELFTVFCELSAAAILNIKLYNDTLKAKEVEKDLEIANLIQQSLLPKNYIKTPALEFYAKSISAKTVGGDYYFAKTLKDKSFVFIIGDIAGKGVAASLFMVKIMTEIQFLLAENVLDEKLVEKLNSSLTKEFKKGKFTTFLYSKFSPGNKVTLISCGHHPPVLVRGGRTRKISVNSSLPLGIVKQLNINSVNFNLKPDDKLFFYTDGVTEGMNAKRQVWGDARFYKTLRTTAGFSVKNSVNKVIQNVLKFSKSGALADDITIAGVKWKK